MTNGKYNIIKLQAYILASIFLSGNVIAGAMGEYESTKRMKNIYLGIDGGYSMSLNGTNFTPYSINNIPTSGQTISVPGNTTFQRDIGDSGMVGGFLGYQVNDSLSFNINYDYRGWFSWQVPTTGVLASGVNDFIYSVKNIKIQTLFVNFVINPNKDWEGWGKLTPYVSGGLGASFNQVGKLNNIDLFDPDIYSSISGASVTNFAWNAGLGINYDLSNHLSYMLGYRFVYAGALQSSGNFSNPTGTFSINPFKANHILLNEVITGFKWKFDA